MKKKIFSFWVCSFSYGPKKTMRKWLLFHDLRILKEILQSMGCKQAKKKLFLENEKQEDKGSNGSSRESLYNKNCLDIKLINYEVKVTKNIFSLENIFNESQKIFDPILILKT